MVKSVRLDRISVKNFKAFVDADIDFEPATVFVGANDSGKSTLLDAIHWIFSYIDRTGEVYTRDGHAFREHGRGPFRLPDNPSSRPMVVRARFSDLSAREAAVWAPAMSEGALTFGRRLDDDDESGELHLVISAAQRAALTDFERARPDADAATLAPDVLGDDLIEPFDGAFWMSLDSFGELITSGEVTFWPGPLPNPYRDFPSPANVVVMGGPASGAERPAEVLRPIIARAIRARLPHADMTSFDDVHDSYVERDDLSGLLIEATRAVIEEVSSAYSRALPRYTSRAGGAVVYQRDVPFDLMSKMIDHAIGGLGVDITDRHVDPSDPHESDPLSDEIENTGAGTRHAAALAALELFREQAIWPADQSVLLLVEEPEMGLHPAAQRQVVAALHDLPTFGVQLVVVTHSAAFVNAVRPEGLRLVRSAPKWDTTGMGSTVFRPMDLREIATELGVTPADVLLARRFLVVEGSSDGAILSHWARLGGRSLEDAGVRIIPVHGQGTAPLVARFLDIAYEGASLWVVLDQGRDTDRTRQELEARFGDRVVVRLLTRHEIEGYLPGVAIERWIESQGRAVGAEERVRIDRAAAGPSVKAGLRTLTHALLGREYRVVEDGTAIAALTRESEVPQELRDLLVEIVAD